ncbi:MAG: hydroxyisourate hydrolase [Candidatus Velthaea sp.]|jgi:5-hydroxyisourate hydrolase
MNATLSSHVLDTARGVPAAGVAVTLFRIDGAQRAVAGVATTDADGRTGAQLGSGLAPGTYEVVFHVAAYFGATPAFYDEITVRIVLDGSRERYHVPLLLAPYGYSTYRGS